MALNYCAADCQAQSRPAFLRRDEGVKDILQLFWIDAGPGVLNLDNDCVVDMHKIRVNVSLRPQVSDRVSASGGICYSRPAFLVANQTSAGRAPAPNVPPGQPPGPTEDESGVDAEFASCCRRKPLRAPRAGTAPIRRLLRL
jgi:hypothetical protein